MEFKPKSKHCFRKKDKFKDKKRIKRIIFLKLEEAAQIQTLRKLSPLSLFQIYPSGYNGIIQRKLYPVVPPKTEYSLTERGKRLIPSIIESNKWGLTYLKEMNIPCAYRKE